MNASHPWPGIARLALVLAVGLIGFACPGPGEETGRGPAASPPRDITAQELLDSRPDGATLLDVRTAEEYASGHVPGARNVPITELKGRLDELEAASSDPVIVYCERGPRAARAIELLLASGYTNVRHLAGDMSGWRAAGLPMESP